VVAEVERRMADDGADGYTHASSADVLRRDRASH
jgi:hypothetical protein